MNNFYMYFHTLTNFFLNIFRLYISINTSIICLLHSISYVKFASFIAGINYWLLSSQKTTGSIEYCERPRTQYLIRFLLWMFFILLLSRKKLIHDVYVLCNKRVSISCIHAYISNGVSFRYFVQLIWVCLFVCLFSRVFFLLFSRMQAVVKLLVTLPSKMRAQRSWVSYQNNPMAVVTANTARLAAFYVLHSFTTHSCRGI